MEEEEMKQQQRMVIMKDWTKKIRSKARMDAKKRWWVAEILAPDCEKTWTHAGGEYDMQKWYEWRKYVNKKDEKEKMEEMHQHKVAQVISAQVSAGLLHKITKPTPWRGGSQILKTEEEDARLLDRREAKMKEWAKHWQCDEEVQNVEEKPWKNKELRKWEEGRPRLKESHLEEVSRLFKAKTGVGCDGFHPKVPLDLIEETRGQIVDFLEKVERRGKWPQQACTTMFFSNP